jgi:hypothetical protein
MCLCQKGLFTVYIGLQSIGPKPLSDCVCMDVQEIFLLEVNDIMCICVCEHSDCLANFKCCRFGGTTHFIFDIVVVFTFVVSRIDTQDSAAV